MNVTKTLMNQHLKLLDILSDGQPHCVTEMLERFKIVDYRKRLSELKKDYNLVSEPCRGKCGRNHVANLHQWTLIKYKPLPPARVEKKVVEKKEEPIKQEQLWKHTSSS